MNATAYQIIKDTYDYETCKEIVSHGCKSGVCSEHIYYADTINKYLNLTTNTWKLPVEYTTIAPCTKDIEFGYDTIDRELIRDLMMLDYGLVFPD